MPWIFTLAATARNSASIDTQSEMLSSLALGANNVMATAAGNTIQLWDRESKTFLTSLSSARGVPWIMRFNPQGTLLATAGGNHIELWDTVSHKILAVLPATDWVTDLSFAADGQTFAVGGQDASHVGLAGLGFSRANPARRLRIPPDLAGIQRQAAAWPSAAAMATSGSITRGQPLHQHRARHPTTPAEMSPFAPERNRRTT